jgi:hypothetical protein
MEPEHSPAPRSRRLERILAVLLAVVVVGGLGSYALSYVLSPASIRHPVRTHFHFRMLLLSTGHPVNFANNAFQTDFNHDICTAIFIGRV